MKRHTPSMGLSHWKSASTDLRAFSSVLWVSKVKDNMGALTVGVAVFTPYIKNETNSLGLVYNVFFDKNCCPVKYPKK